MSGQGATQIWHAVPASYMRVLLRDNPGEGRVAIRRKPTNAYYQQPIKKKTMVIHTITRTRVRQPTRAGPTANNAARPPPWRNDSEHNAHGHITGRKTLEWMG